MDNRCSGCISNDINDFVGTMTDSDRVIKGFGGELIRDVKIGTLKWSWRNDEGKITTVSYTHLTLPTILLV